MPEAPPAPSGPNVRVAELNFVYLHVDQIVANDRNTNYETHEQFVFLCEELKTKPFGEPLKVVPTPQSNQHGPIYRILRGEHRYRAAKIVGYTHLPCLIGTESDEDDQKIDTVRGNFLRGQQDTGRFSALFDEIRSRQGLSEEDLRKQMAITQSSFERLYQNRAQQSEAARQEQAGDLQDTERHPKAIDNLSVLLHAIFTEHGDDLEHGFMAFNYGGQVHVMVLMTTSLRNVVDEILEGVRKTRKQDLSRVFEDLLTGHVALQDLAFQQELPLEEKAAPSGGDG